MSPERHHWKPAVQATAVMLRMPAVDGQSPTSQPRPLVIYGAQCWESLRHLLFLTCPLGLSYWSDWWLSSYSDTSVDSVCCRGFSPHTVPTTRPRPPCWSFWLTSCSPLTPALRRSICTGVARSVSSLFWLRPAVYHLHDTVWHRVQSLHIVRIWQLASLIYHTENDLKMS